MVIDKIEKNIERVAPLPTNIQRIMSIVNDADGDMADLAKVVEEDPALTMQALNLCKSAYYAVPFQVASVSHAVRYLGIKTVGGLAMAAYFRDLLGFATEKTNPWLAGAGTHLLQVAQMAEKLSRTAGGLVSPATMFTAGLLHDVGKLVFSKLDVKYAHEIEELVLGGTMTAVEAERQILGMDHAEGGARLAERWEIPEIIIDAIRYHHDPLSNAGISPAYIFLSDKIFYLARQEGDLGDFFNQSVNHLAMEAACLSRDLIQEAVELFREDES